MRAIIAVPRYLSLFAFPFHLPHFFITSSDLNRSSILCSQFKTRFYPLAWLFVDFGSFSACGHCSLPSDHQKQADAAITQLVLSGVIVFFFLKIHKHNWKTCFWYCTGMGCGRKGSIIRQEVGWNGSKEGFVDFFNDIHQFFIPCAEKQNNRLRGHT